MKLYVFIFSASLKCKIIFKGKERKGTLFKCLEQSNEQVTHSCDLIVANNSYKLSIRFTREISPSWSKLPRFFWNCWCSTIDYNHLRNCSSIIFSIFSTPHVNSIKQPRWCTLTITQQLSPLPCLIYEEKFGAVQIYKGCYSLDGNISCTLAHRTAQDIHLLGTCSKLFFTYHPAATSIKHCKIAFLKVCTMFDFGINSAE